MAELNYTVVVAKNALCFSPKIRADLFQLAD